MNIGKIDNISFYQIHKVLTSNSITESQKIQFLRNNKLEIENLAANITGKEFEALMKNRPLLKFQPVRNSFKKRVDRILLAKSLNIQPDEIPGYINQVTEELKILNDLNFLPKDKLEAVKTYIYRHGSKDQLITFLDYELTCAKDTIKTLFSTLEYHSGGAADFFIRPIHRMDNKTFIKMYRILDKHIKKEQSIGNISEAESEKIGKWALIKLYQIKNNSKLINAVKTYKTLK